VFYTQREVINLNFVNRPRGDFHFVFLFSTQVETQSNQIRCDGGKSNEWENKENTQNGRRRVKVSSYVHSIFSFTPKTSWNQCTSVNGRRATTRKVSSKFCESSSSSMCSDEYKTKYKQIQSKALFRFTWHTKMCCCCLPAVPKRKIKCNKFPHIFEFVWFGVHFSIQLQRALFVFVSSRSMTL
jgi:hypothetical protein